MSHGTARESQGAGSASGRTLFHDDAFPAGGLDTDASGNYVVRDKAGVIQLQVGTSGVTVPGSGLSVNASGTRNAKVAKVALSSAADTGGAVLSWANPEAGDILIIGLYVDLTTKSTGASTVDFGTTATSGTTSSDNLIDGVDLGTAAGFFCNIDDKGTNGKSRQRLAPGKWITGSRASGAVAGLVGSAYISYLLA